MQRRGAGPSMPVERRDERTEEWKSVGGGSSPGRRRRRRDEERRRDVYMKRMASLGAGRAGVAGRKEGRKEGCGQSMPGKKKGTANAHVKSDENGKRMRPSNYRTGDGELQSGENDLAGNYPQVSGVCVPARLGRVLSSAGGRAGGRASDDAERKKCSPRTVAHLKHGDATAHDPRAGERGRLRTRSNLPIRSRSPSWLKRPRPGPAFRVW